MREKPREVTVLDGKKVIEIKCKGADTLPIDRILEFQGELKTLSKGNEKKLRNSILKFGFIAPFFVWDDKGEWRLLDGHQRLKTLLKMREEGYDIPLLPVDYIEADSEEDAKRKLLHITSQYGEFSPEGFENFTLELDGFENIRLTDGEFDISFLRDKDEAKDDNYEIPDEIETDIKVGDIFQIGEHRLMCGDSTDAEMVAKLMDGQKADMVFTDPPYGIDIEGDNGKVGAGNIAKNKVYSKVIADDTTEVAEKAYNIFKNVADRMMIWGGNYFVDFLEFSPSWLIWDKRLDMNSNNFADGEMVWCSFHTRVRIYKHLWNGMIQEGERETRVHPTQKPVKLLGNILKDQTQDGDLILDVFGGSGSTLIACEQLNRTCYMMELDPKYCQVIIDRMRELDGTIEIRRNGELYD